MGELKGNELAEVAYNAWDREAREHVGSMPPFSTLPNGIQNAWAAAVERAIEAHEDDSVRRLSSSSIERLFWEPSEDGGWECNEFCLFSLRVETSATGEIDWCVVWDGDSATGTEPTLEAAKRAAVDCAESMARDLLAMVHAFRKFANA